MALECGIRVEGPFLPLDLQSRDPIFPEVDTASGSEEEALGESHTEMQSHLNTKMSEIKMQKIQGGVLPLHSGRDA